MTHLEQLGARLRQLRLDNKLTLKQAGEALLYDASNLSKIEKGKLDISTESIIRICKFYNVSPSYLLGMDENSHN